MNENNYNEILLLMKVCYGLVIVNSEKDNDALEKLSEILAMNGVREEKKRLKLYNK